MTPLTQQLEDKKKGCGIDLGGVPCGEFIAHTEDEDGREWGKTYYCPICQAEIAILEQAKDEMQKQRQSSLTAKEILDKMQEIVDSEKKRCDEANAYTCWHHLKKYLEQLNQPKTK